MENKVVEQGSSRVKDTRKRKLQDVAGLDVFGNVETEPLCEFELERQQRIQRNRQILAEMGLHEAAAAVEQAMNRQKRPHARNSKPKAVQDPADLQPSRRSSRIACSHSVAAVATAVSAAAEGAGNMTAVDAAAARKAAEDDRPDTSSLMSQAQYFQRQGLQLTGFEVDGHFRGWVSPEICKMYNIAASSGEVWEAGGGGTFTRQLDKSAVPRELKQRGWSDAKAFSATQLRKNPNAYFYRHVAPHEQQAQGEWTEEEHQLFLEVARQHGVGDKWGLFASHIPQRVGYQCSAYYRDVMVACGLIVDQRFKMTPGGRAVFVGGGGSGGGQQ